VASISMKLQILPFIEILQNAEKAIRNYGAKKTYLLFVEILQNAGKAIRNYGAKKIELLFVEILQIVIIYAFLFQQIEKQYETVERKKYNYYLLKFYKTQSK
jgi:hypothetical protein